MTIATTTAMNMQQAMQTSDSSSSPMEVCQTFLRRASFDPVMVTVVEQSPTASLFALQERVD
jgi:hypothetical protein